MDRLTLISDPIAASSYLTSARAGAARRPRARGGGRARRGPYIEWLHCEKNKNEKKKKRQKKKRQQKNQRRAARRATLPRGASSSAEAPSRLGGR
jgi:hypothetical protein